MTIGYLDGFDHYSAAQAATYKGWNTTFNSNSAARLGSGQCANLANNTALHPVAAATSHGIAGIAVGRHTAPVNSKVLGLYASGVVVAAVIQAVVGPITVWRIVNSAGTTLATGTTPVVPTAFTYIELRAKVSATVGEVELRLNGSSVAECSATNVNTGAANIDQVGFSTVGGGGDTAFDDLYFVDMNTGSSPTNTWLGDIRVETLYPTSNGTNTAWTGVYTDVDEPLTVNNDTDYITSSTPGDKETYGLTDLSVSTGQVFAIQHNVVARKDDAGVRTIAPVLRVAGVDYDGTTTGGLSTSYQGYRQLYERLDPAGNAWSVANVNSMEAGVKEVA